MTAGLVAWGFKSEHLPWENTLTLVSLHSTVTVLTVGATGFLGDRLSASRGATLQNYRIFKFR